MTYDYEKAEKIHNEMAQLDFKSSKDITETAVILCEKYGIPFSDLVLYEQELKRKLQAV